jgi:HK97 family phage portal protein
MSIFDFAITMAPKKEESNSSGAKRMANTIILPWESGRELATPEDFESLIRAYRSWVYICASKNSNAVAAAPLKLYVAKKKKDTKVLVKTIQIDKVTDMRLRKQGNLLSYIRKAEDMEEVVDSPVLDLFKNVNPLMNHFDLWDGTQLWLELTGNAYWYIYKNNLGVPVEIWPIPPQYMQIVASQEKIISGYVYKKGIVTIPFDFDEIVHFRFFAPSGGLYGVGPLQAVMDSYIDDQRIKVFESTLMTNMGRPEAVLQAKESISDAEFERIKRRWKQQYGGAKKVGQTLILESGLEYKPITFTPKEMAYTEGRRLNKEEIAAAFGVPMSKLTTEDVNRSNASSGNWQYQNDTIEPRLRRIEETINEKLMPMFDEALFIAYDSTLPADEAFELDRMTKSLGSYVTTVNEEREKLGMKPVEWGDTPLASSTIAPLSMISPDDKPDPVPPTPVMIGPDGKPIKPKTPPVDQNSKPPDNGKEKPGQKPEQKPPKGEEAKPKKELDFIDRVVLKVQEKMAQINI